jgi:DNA polymerase-4
MMDLQVNDVKPLIMHVDLNSCYAIIEQQANRLIRNKPVGVAAYTSPRGFIIASSYEAKRQGIKLMRIQDAWKIDRNIIILPPDPEKYFDAHRRFRAVLERYTNAVTPKSVDEFIVDFKGSRAIQEGRSLVDVGYQIKKDIKQALGEYVTVNIGIGPNRFLAKVAAGLDKPDGLNVVTARDVWNIYGQLDLMDLPGINHRFKARLNFAGIFTPLDFLEAPMHKLKHEVFKSIVGYYWFLRLRGYEIDAVKFPIRSFGNDFAIKEWTMDRDVLSRYLMKLSEKTGRRLRKHDYQAHGMYLGVAFEDRTWWGKSRRSSAPIYSTQEIYLNLMRLFNQVEFPAKVTHINIAAFDVAPATPIQLGLFDGTRLDTKSLARAADKINDRYGEFTVAPAKMANMKHIIIKRVPFGSVRDI